jgi:hypothetical protein
VYAEPEIEMEGVEWKKYSTDFLESSCPNLSAFSHFSYKASDKKLLIDDIQGKDLVLSDLVIHTI